jgi:hypothetical protein
MKPRRSLRRLNDVSKILSILLVLAVAATACGGTEPAGTPDTTGIPDIVPTTQSPVSTDPAADLPDPVLSALVDDATERLGVARDEVEVLSSRAVTWNDGALGCPEPGMFYTQALVEGQQVVIAGPEDTLDYRVDSSGEFRICGESDSVSGAVDAAVAESRRMLAETSGADSESFVLVSAGPTSVPPDEPCRPGLTQEMDPDIPLVQAIEVVLTADGIGHRFVTAEDVTHDCGAALDSRGTRTTP